MNNNQTLPGLNVLSTKTRDSLNNNLMEMDVIDGVANIINTSGKSRSQRRRLEKALARSNKLTEKAQKKLDYSAYKTYKEITDLDFTHFNAVLGIVLHDDYGWEESEDDDFGVITELFENIQLKMRQFNDEGKTTYDIVKMLEDKTGIILVPDNVNNQYD